jgi:polyisoprenoid-binding protein YceI
MKNNKRSSVLSILVLALVLARGTPAAAGDAGAPAYTIDPVHSTIGFAVKHLGVSTTRGKFTEYEGVVRYDPDNPAAFETDVTIQAASINTDNEGRDNHLRSGDFLAADEFPVITFKSNRLEKRGEGHVIVGDLTIRGVTRQITFPVALAGPVDATGGKTVAALEAVTAINRQDYGVSWSKTLDTGGLVVSDTVELVVELELHRK